jgi:hypothetical protein
MNSVAEEFAEFRAYGDESYQLTREEYAILKGGFVAGYASGSGAIWSLLTGDEPWEEKQAAIARIKRELIELGLAARRAGSSGDPRKFI